MLPRSSTPIEQSNFQIQRDAYICLVQCPNREHWTNYLPFRHKHVCLVATLSVYASLKDKMITTNPVSGRGPFQELSVIGEESCELVALCVSRLQAGIVETPLGRHNMAVGTWCVKQACYSWIIHGRMPSHEIRRVEKQGNKRRKIQETEERKRERPRFTTVKQKTGVVNHQEASWNLLKAGSSSASAILHCSQHIVAVLRSYLPANNELVWHRVHIIAYHFCQRKAS